MTAEQKRLLADGLIVQWIRLNIHKAELPNIHARVRDIWRRTMFLDPGFLTDETTLAAYVRAVPDAWLLACRREWSGWTSNAIGQYMTKPLTASTERYTTTDLLRDTGKVLGELGKAVGEGVGAAAGGLLSGLGGWAIVLLAVGYFALKGKG